VDALLSAAATFGIPAAAGVVVIWMGRRRGIDQIESRSDAALKALVDAQSERLALMERERTELRARISLLETEVASLRKDLEMERRITARFTQGDGR
jgi:hypothetical protein